MPRNRMIKCDFWTSEQVISCSPTARLLFIGLWNFADDNGVHPASYVKIKAEVFPADNFNIAEVKQWIIELIQQGLLREYTVEEKSYWVVTGWKNHQKIDKPTYRYPYPQTELRIIPSPPVQFLPESMAITNGTFDHNSVSSCQIDADNSRVLAEKLCGLAER